jgi:hypothetical protein
MRRPPGPRCGPSTQHFEGNETVDVHGAETVYCTNTDRSLAMKPAKELRYLAAALVVTLLLRVPSTFKPIWNVDEGTQRHDRKGES